MTKRRIVDTPTGKYQENLDYFTKYAQDNWIPIHNIFVAASNFIGADTAMIWPETR